MSEAEDKGFTVKDKRFFTAEAEAGPERAAEGPKPEPEARRKPEPEPAGQAEARQRVPLPEVSFATFVFSMHSSALLHLGDVPDPFTGEAAADLELAKHTIDTLGMLKDKTRGNLDEEEQKLIDSVLYDLRMRYVQAVKNKKAGG